MVAISCIIADDSDTIIKYYVLQHRIIPGTFAAGIRPIGGPGLSQRNKS
jgi:hypothetical protein